jgi:hypothetical protein
VVDVLVSDGASPTSLVESAGGVSEGVLEQPPNKTPASSVVRLHVTLPKPADEGDRVKPGRNDPCAFGPASSRAAGLCSEFGRAATRHYHAHPQSNEKETIMSKTRKARAKSNTTQAVAAPSTASVATRANVEHEVVAKAPATHDEIARRAYELWLARGRKDGTHLEDWLAAERELHAA